MDEYRFEHPTLVRPGRVVFNPRNVGQLEHQLAVMHLPKDVASLDAQLRSSRRRVVGTVRLLPKLAPGKTRPFATDLAPGRYGLGCFLSEPDGSIHALKGMNSEFTVTDPARPPRERRK